MKLGQVVITKGILNSVTEDFAFYEFILESLKRYKNHDWGNLPNEDKRMNDLGDSRILARYNNKHSDIYIITEWDRSVTTILFCDEY